MTPYERLAKNITSVEARIARAAQRVGRQPHEIILVAATKYVPTPIIEQAVRLGIENVGENRVHEAMEKYSHLGTDRIKLHMLGHLQSRKVKDAVNLFSMIQSVESISLAQELSKRCQALEKTLDILIEVNISGEESKDGLSPQEILGFLKAISPLPNLKVQGLMTMAPLVRDPELVRPVFRELKRLKEEIENQAIPNIAMRYLSMGMTNDFEVAIEEGSNMVRIGTALFGGLQG